LLQIRASSLLNRNAESKRLLSKCVGFNVLVSDETLPDEGFCRELKMHGKKLALTFVVKKGFDVLKTLALLPRWLHDDIHFYCPYRLEVGDRNLSCAKVFRLLREVRKRFPGLAIRGPLGIDVWDPRVDPQLSLEPVINPCFETATKKQNLRVSVVIPS